MQKYFLIIKNTWDEYLVYRLNFILWRVRVVIRFLITYFLWSSIFSGGGNIFGYTRDQMLTYTLLIYLVSNFVFATRTQDIGGEINDGTLTNYLLRPVNYFSWLISRDMSDKLINFGFTIFEIIIMFFILKPPFFLQTSFFLLFISLISFLGSIIIFFCISALLGFIGFWTNEVWSPRFIFIVLLDFLAGNLFPIDIYPVWLSKILLLTPFPYLYYFPVKLYLGNLNQMQVLQGFVVLTVWIMILVRSVQSVWQKGLKVYSAEGR
jgi:ABC-2 type transport system permease protein